MLKERKKELKYQRQREDTRFFRIFMFSMILGVLNYIFWHDQFLNLDVKYNIFFVVLPMILGVILFYLFNKIFIKNITTTKSSGKLDTVLSNGFLILTALFFAYFSVVTIANGLFKIGMNNSIDNLPITLKTYVVESTFKNNRGRGVHLYSDIFYLDENNEIKIFNVNVDEVETSYAKRKITFKCYKGFWGYYKIIDYTIE